MQAFTQSANGRDFTSFCAYCRGTVTADGAVSSAVPATSWLNILIRSVPLDCAETEEPSSTIQAPSINTTSFNSQNLAINGGDVTVDNNIDINGDVTATTVLANTVNAGTINANGCDLVVGTVDVQNNMVINGSVNVTTGSVVVDRMVADGCTRINVGLAADTRDGNPDGFEYYGTGPACP